MASIPHLNGLQAKFGQKGFNLFAFESQGTEAGALKKFIKDRNITYPVSSGGGGDYEVKGLPTAYLIGVNGKVLWTGNSAREQGNIDKLIKEEMAKIKYPGLGKLDVDSKVAAQATAFAAKQYGTARDGAMKLLDRAGVTADEVNAAADAKTITGKGAGEDAPGKEVELTPTLRDAAFIVKRVSDVHAKLIAKADKFVESKDYLDAQNIHTQIVSTFGKKSPEGLASDEKLGEWKKDKEIQKEIKAQAELVSTLTRIAKLKDDAKKLQLEAFIKKNEGTRAAEKAQAEMP